MKRLVVVLAIGAVSSALFALSGGCGPGDDKPPLTPDTEVKMDPDAGPSTPSQP